MAQDVNLAALLTETRNPASANIDALPTEEMLRVFNDEDAKIAAIVRAEIPNIARAVDAIADRFERGGRLFYTGAGTSGRLGVLDASECPPTFSVSPELVVGIMAGGDYALRNPVEGAEDSRERGVEELKAVGFGKVVDGACVDTLVGIAASGRTPYVLGAMEYAKEVGALTVGLSCVPDSLVAQAAEIAITPATGAEVITGSTRMKAGTATKLALNMLSTGVMIRAGYVYGNLMVNVQTTNEKLVDRAERIIVDATGCDRARAAELLKQAGTVKVAIVMEMLGVSREEAEAKLAAKKGHLRRTLEG
ncbi:MAG: N-acetylmuramic acid 6-phosphate etherase [Acidobacteria bacterium]|nr:N-acetylmuramic acid 6-phosphate etherase [Acidobacteriota bacterium]